MKKIILIAMIMSLFLMVACKENEEGLVSDDIILDFTQEATLPGNDTKDNSEVVIEEEIYNESDYDELLTLTDSEILFLQEALKIAGYYTALDGEFGTSAKKQLIAFQNDNNLKSEAYDLATKKLLTNIINKKKVPGLNTYQLLLNKNYHLPSTYIPENVRLVNTQTTKDVYLPDEVAIQVERMISDAAKEGLAIYVVSGYRSYAYQERIFSNRVAAYGFDEAEQIIAIPGQSEHQTGLAMDVTSEAVDFGLWEAFEDTPEFEWLMEHCHEYGFILRYLKGRTETTGYVYEPWHYRYVQDPEIAKAIMDQNITLEEYLGD